jgi:membrane protein implicated in regulation of membrane protease activity
VMLVLEILATGVSLLAIGALGLISFVPFLGLAALPVQLLAWLFRSLVFQYLALTGVATYLTLYRRHGSPAVHATRRTGTDEASYGRG